MYTTSNVKASEYEIGFYNPIYQINIGNKSFFEAKLKYGNKGKCCKYASSEEIKECVTSHPAFKNAPDYNLLMGNCRDRAKSILKDCCMEINEASRRPARKGYVLRRYLGYIGQRYEEYGDKNGLNLTSDRNAMPML